jgi:2-desacetyl-2-hydroxyethyl bacteriochlorophyllide A dehydrogenase
MKSVQLIAHGKPGQFQLRDLPDPQPATGEVVVQVFACGLNHLDLWLEERGLPVPIQLPRTPGCEIAGRILTTGEGVRDWNKGDRVAVQSNIFCGQCEFCARREESLCLNSDMVGVQRDGGFAEQVIVPQRALVGLPDNVEFETSAALTLAGSTAMHMLTSRTAIKTGDWVLVMGASSGVGSAAIQIASQLGAHVIATASSKEKQDLALKLGAQQVVNTSNESWPAEVRRITAKHGVDVVVEHVGGKVLEQAFNCLARGGAIVTCGATTGREVTLDLWPLFVKQHRLIGSYGRNRIDLERTLEWAAAGKLHPVIHRILSLKETPRAFAALRDRTVLGKLVIRTAAIEPQSH